MDPDFYRKQAARRLITIAVLIIIAGGVYWYLSRPGSLKQIASWEGSILKTATQPISQQFSGPPPLRLPNARTVPPADRYALTREGVIVDTNTERQKNGDLPPLEENAALDTIAALRLGDMFAKQYFAHVSPSGSSAMTVASSVGYQYIALGENLALGNFNGDQGVVTAWMGSPGHRANILNARYTQIGVAVKEGIFEGQDTWLAVQVFGKPASDCPEPDVKLKGELDAANTELAQMNADLGAKRAAIDAMQPGGVGYNETVDAYNAEVGQYNALVAQAKAEVSQYNAEVNSFNQCIAQ
ncbi:MAG: hypothetical protein KGJ13_04605 [Patescibacteria group bacterium]|nr:hypothetical protein [Patescibacteria group bacterium]